MNRRLELSNVSKSYLIGSEEVQVLNSVRYAFPDRGSVAILGRSGIGKSTLLHLIAGLDQVDSGQIFIDGEDIQALTDEQRSNLRSQKMGFVFQFHHLLPEFTALENVALPLWTDSTLEEEECSSRAMECLSAVGLKSRAHHRPGELSGGEQQRVAVARALVSRPAIILADEPTGNLDEATARSIESVLKEQTAELGALLIVVTHSKELSVALDFRVEMTKGGHLT